MTHGLGANAKTFSYGYVPNSDALVASVTGPVHTGTNTWESDRDVLDQKINKVGTTTVSSYDYSVNAIGQRTNVTHAGTAFGQQGAFDVYDYNGTGELTSGTQYAAGTPSDPQTPVAGRGYGYTYDGIGNRTSARPDGTSTTVSYSPNNLNQYASINGTPLSYDDDGNLLNDGALACAWDGENRLVEATKSGTTAASLYDGMSRRVRKTVEAGGTTTASTAFLYDGWNVVAEYDVSGGTPTLVATNIWGLDLSSSIRGAGGVGGLLARLQAGGVVQSYTYDGNGNVSEMLDDAGSVAAHYEYDPFGGVVARTAPPRQPARGGSARSLRTMRTGLLYYGYRFYQPLSGRWINRDPIGEAGDINLYGFNYNNSMSWIDVLGLEIETFPSLDAAANEAGKRAKQLAEDWDKGHNKYGGR